MELGFYAWNLSKNCLLPKKHTHFLLVTWSNKSQEVFISNIFREQKLTLGFQTSGEEFFGPQKHTLNTEPQEVFGRLARVRHSFLLQTVKPFFVPVLTPSNLPWDTSQEATLIDRLEGSGQMPRLPNKLSAVYGGHYWLEVYSPRYMSGDSGMYPYQRTPMGNPYIRPI